MSMPLTVLALLVQLRRVLQVLVLLLALLQLLVIVPDHPVRPQFVLILLRVPPTHTPTPSLTSSPGTA